MNLVAAVGNHLWQSTLFTAAAGLAVPALRRSGAAARHALWLTASIKFLVPFAALMALGAQFGVRAPEAAARTEFVVIVETAGQPFTPSLPPIPPPAASGAASTTPWAVIAIWLCGSLVIAGAWVIRWRRVARLAREAAAVHAGRELDALRRLERAAGIAKPIALVASTTLHEPGVFGLCRPVLIWPRTIGEQLSEEEIVTILAHEVSHVRRRDNLTAAIHMVVEALFWFHPLVWWLGARLVDERERACDEAVVQSGSEPEVYAGTILKACRAYVETPLACVSGVTGSNLSARIERIMTNRAAARLAAWQRLLLAALPAAALVAPIVAGALAAPRLRAESIARSAFGGRGDGQAPQFEVASVKPNRSGDAKVLIQTLPGGRFTAENVTLRMLIRNAYQLQDVQMAGGPSWLNTDRFDIVAKADGDGPGDPFAAERPGTPSRGQLMLRALLAERFRLEVHNESREMPIYALVPARSGGALGPQLHHSSLDCSAPGADRRVVASSKGSPAAGHPQCGIRLFPGNMIAGGASMGQIAGSLATFVARLVFDRTGLAGVFDFTLTWTPDQMPQPGYDRKAAAMGLAPIDPNGPSIFTAVQEQLGLKLDSQKGPVDVLVIDRAEHPKEN